MTEKKAWNKFFGLKSFANHSYLCVLFWCFEKYWTWRICL